MEYNAKGSYSSIHLKGITVDNATNYIIKKYGVEVDHQLKGAIGDIIHSFDEACIGASMLDELLYYTDYPEDIILNFYDEMMSNKKIIIAGPLNELKIDDSKTGMPYTGIGIKNDPFISSDRTGYGSENFAPTSFPNTLYTHKGTLRNKEEIGKWRTQAFKGHDPERKLLKDLKDNKI